MSEYVKLYISFKERVLFLFTGLIKKDHIISKTVEPKGSGATETDIQNVQENDDDTPFKVDIPFFELEEGKTKGNLNG